MSESLISEATKNNWQRLNVEKTDFVARLSKRANKRFSNKNIIPVEYFTNKDNLEILNLILSYVRESNCSIRNTVYSLALNYLQSFGLVNISSELNFSCKNKYLSEILKTFSAFPEEYLLKIDYPKDERDFLGIVYQSLLKEGSKNKQGSYYTPADILKILKDKILDSSVFLDPCCGTGSFLLLASEKIHNPENIYGSDIDEIACFISKINLIVKFRNIEFSPNIYNVDFIEDKTVFKSKTFDIIATNPPWGAVLKDKYREDYSVITSGESFSYFILKSFNLLKDSGECAFLLPKSILNVGVHKDIRKFILDNYQIKAIHLLGKAFSGVLTDVTFLDLSKRKDKFPITIYRGSEIKHITSDLYKKNEKFVFSILDDVDAKILDKLYSKDYETLEDSLWALGIVTGNNKKFISNTFNAGQEIIYTGKDISKYFLKDSTNFVKYDRENFQQIALDKFYRAKEKLVYKFISKNLVFAYDNSGSLILNSANLLIPKMKTYSIKTVLALLNSELFQYIYSTKFNELKVLKSNLLQLPFPILDKSQKNEIDGFVEDYLETKSEEILRKIDDCVYKLFDLSKEEIKYIKSFKL